MYHVCRWRLKIDVRDFHCSSPYIKARSLTWAQSSPIWLVSLIRMLQRASVPWVLELQKGNHTQLAFYTNTGYLKCSSHATAVLHQMDYLLIPVAKFLDHKLITKPFITARVTRTSFSCVEDAMGLNSFSVSTLTLELPRDFSVYFSLTFIKSSFLKWDILNSTSCYECFFTSHLLAWSSLKQMFLFYIILLQVRFHGI